MRRRGFEPEVVVSVARSPDQVVIDPEGREICQSRVLSSRDHNEYLVRVVLDSSPIYTTVLTAYRTSKISKYWRRA